MLRRLSLMGLESNGLFLYSEVNKEKYRSPGQCINVSHNSLIHSRINLDYHHSTTQRKKISAPERWKSQITWLSTRRRIYWNIYSSLHLLWISLSMYSISILWFSTFSVHWIKIARSAWFTAVDVPPRQITSQGEMPSAQLANRWWNYVSTTNQRE